MLEDWLVSSDSKELPRDRVPGTDRKLEWVSGILVLGDETLWEDVGRLSRSRSRASDEALERMEPDERISGGELLPLLNGELASYDSALSVESWSDGSGGPERICTGGLLVSGEFTAEVSMVMVGALSLRSGPAGDWAGSSSSRRGSDMVKGFDRTERNSHRRHKQNGPRCSHGRQFREGSGHG